MAAPLPFRRRIFVILVVMTVVPTVLAVALGAVVRRLLPAAAPAPPPNASRHRPIAARGRGHAAPERAGAALLRQHFDEVSAP